MSLQTAERLARCLFPATLLAAALLLGPAPHACAEPVLAGGKTPLKPMVTGLKNPESVAIGTDGRIYISVIGEFDKDGDGAVMVVQDGKAVPFAIGLDDPKGLIAWRDWLFVTDKKRVWRIDKKGKATVFAAAAAFPSPPVFLNDIDVEPQSGTFYVSDSGDTKGKGAAVYSIDEFGKVGLVIDSKKYPALKGPNGVQLEGVSFLNLADFGTGELHRVRLRDGTAEKIAEGLGGADGVARDNHGRLFLTDWSGGRVFVIPRPGRKPVLLASGFKSAADCCLDASGKFLLVPDMLAGTLTKVPAVVPGEEIDERPLALESEVAFPKLRWTGWKPRDKRGVPVPLRPLLLTHAGDGSNRVFVGTQHGVVHVFANDQAAAETKVFLDIQDRVRYHDDTNEEGFLGLAFHPKYKTNGEFFVYYTTKKEKLVNIVSRFRVKRDDPNQADPASEEVLLRMTKPFWNHDGGTLCFGPDGYLYIAVGDGGAANDPFENGQNLKTMLGKIHRIDVDRKDKGKAYAIPKDNPFLGKEGARPEIWAYGLRNVWRMSFDRKTGRLWAADVGQDLWEEIDLIERGRNYGWNLREGLHPFGPKGVGPRSDLVEPIWEYHHDVGKSITGGHVYRGKRLPELEGHYLYADYVSAKIWALRYDFRKKRVVANRPIADRKLPVFSFGEDEKGEVYYMTSTSTGEGVYRFVRGKDAKGAKE
jgi:glucose/arabinose dehydrogenase/sugar lactone lactonase YvrE